MKNIQLLLWLLLPTLFMTSCKKEESDNLYINHRVINMEVIAKVDLTYESGEVDIDNNGTVDFIVELSLQKFDKSIRLLGFDVGYYSIAKASSSEDPYITTNMTASFKIDSTVSDWTQLSFLSFYSNLSSIVDVGYAGKGDVLVGVQFLINGKRHFGWLLINVSADRKHVIVKEVAYDIRPNVGIKAGGK